MHRQLDSIPASTSPEDFFQRFVSKRQPVKITGLPKDESFKARAWTDLDYLTKKAGDSQVLIEPIHPESHQFGTDVERIAVPFREFLQSLQKEQGPHHYLTTQYTEQDTDEQTVLPPPADALADDYPQVPHLMGNLGLQQVNLWIGRSKEGATSGLHHDFHDNLYCLLRGRKRFVLYPPSEIKNLYPYGTLDTLHDNGLISYTDAPVRSDGLPVRAALKARVKAIEQKLDVIPKGKGKGKQDTKERKALLKAYDEALDELAQYTLEGDDGLAVDDEVDDFDALMAGLEDDDESGVGDVGLGAKSDDGEEDDEDDDEPDEAGQGALQDDEQIEPSEPPSFSRIPTALVHQHLGLPTTAVAPSSVTRDDFPNLQKTPAPFVVHLDAGEMLYLPASWWHEVTSSSSADDPEPIHMAFNYWFYPPNKFDDFEQPYEDTLVWEYFRSKSRAEANETEESTPTLSSKRKGEDVDKTRDRNTKRSKK